MTGELALLLAQDGIANGAIYVLVALGIVLVFLVTRIVFVPFGDLVAYASLTLASLQDGARPGIIWLVLLLSGLAVVCELATQVRQGRPGRMPRAVVLYGVVPCVPVAVAWRLTGVMLPDPLQILLAIALVVPIGPLLYRIALRPIGDASVLVLLMVSVVLHFAVSGVALMTFGPEGARPRGMSDASFAFAGMFFTAQFVIMLLTAVVAVAALAMFFGFSLSGKALRATAVNRVGARLVGIRPAGAGAIAFILASTLAAICGILIGPVTTLFYDSGFVIGLKAFVGAIIGGLVSYPGAALGALFVGLLESFTAFWDSALKDVVVFAMLVPVLIARSLLQRRGDEDEGDEL
jgi:branched-chain amino acid transport system permease protein